MTKNDMALKRKYLYDGQETVGLVSDTDFKDEESTIDVPDFQRVRPIKSGTKKFEPIELTYKVMRDSDTKKFFSDWFYKDELHDVTVINTDATGAEVDRRLLPDCECSSYSESKWDAGAPDYMKIVVRITCSSTPVLL